MNDDGIKRLEELERLWPVMKDKLVYYDKMMDSIKDLQCKADLHEVNASKNNDYLSSKIDSVNVNLQDRIYKIEEKIQNFSPVILALEFNYEKQAKQISNIQDLIAGINAQLEALSKTQESCCHVDEITAIKSSFESIRDESKQNQFSSNKYTKDLYDENKNVIKNTIDLVNMLRNQIEKLNVSKDDLNLDINKINDELKILKFTQNTMFHDLKNQFIPIIDDKINAIPKPLIPSLDDARSAMQQQLEPVSLDAKNANMRSVNVDAKLHVLEKKVEQIKLMLDQTSLGV